MRTAFKFIVVVAFFAVVTSFWSDGADAKQARPPTKAEVADVWVGLSEDDVYYYRCKLTEDGRGLFVAVFLREKVQALDMEGWVYKDRKIQITLTPDARKASGINSIPGEVSMRQMTLKVAGDNWHKVATLRRETELDERAKLAKAASETRRTP